MADNAVINKIKAAYEAFEAKMTDLHHKRMAWMTDVVGKIEKEQIAKIEADLKK